MKAIFYILGPLEVHVPERICTPRTPKVRQLLSLLLVRANHLVSTESIIREIWDENPPKSALTTVQTYIYQLRNWGEGEGITERDNGLLVTKPFGYTLQIADDQLDFFCFQHLVSEAERLLKLNEAGKADRNLRAAIDMWRDGQALADVTQGPAIRSHVAHLNELYMHALELHIEASIQLGRHRDVICELRSLVAAYPLHEWFHSELILTLNSSGRRGEALAAFHSLRTILAEELGLDPSPAVQRLHQEILVGGQEPRGQSVRISS